MTRLVQRRVLGRAIACLIIAATARGVAQTVSFVGREATVGPVVRGLPYSAEGVTTTRQTLANGTRIERQTKAAFHRDSEGRVRREQTIHGVAALNPAYEARALVTISDPVAGVTFVLDPRSRTVRRIALDRRALASPPPPPPPPPVDTGAPRNGAAPPPPPPPAPPRPEEDSLGTAVIAGVTVAGRRSRTTIPEGHIGNDRPIEIVDEHWISRDLHLLVQSRHDDPRTGTVEYRLVNIVRAEPNADLFSVPSDYVVVDDAAPPPPPPPPPSRKGR